MLIMKNKISQVLTYILQKSHKNIYLNMYFLGKLKKRKLWCQYKKVEEQSRFNEHTQVQMCGWAMMCSLEDLNMKVVAIHFSCVRRYIFWFNSTFVLSVVHVAPENTPVNSASSHHCFHEKTDREREAARNSTVTHPSLFMLSCLNSNHTELPNCCGQTLRVWVRMSVFVGVLRRHFPVNLETKGILMTQLLI